MKKYLLLGGAGFMGSNFLEAALDKEDIFVEATFFRSLPRIVGNNIRYTHIDLITDDLSKLFEGVDVVLHFANQLSTFSILQNNPTGPIIENTILNMKVLQTALDSNIKKMVWISSMTGYPHLNSPEESEFFEGEPIGNYVSVGWMSRYYEKVLALYSRQQSLNVLVLRPTAIYGKYDDFDYETCHSLPGFIRQVVERKSKIQIYGSGENYKDWVYAKDIVQFILQHIDNVSGYEVFNIGSGESISLNQLMQWICEIDCFKEAVIHRTDLSEPKKEQSISLQKIYNKLGHTSPTGIYQGLQETINWYRQTGES